MPDLAPLTPDELARRFHEAYERLAPTFGYNTREASATAWERVPESNRLLMVATVEEVCGPLLAQVAAAEQRERALLNYIGAEWCGRCGGTGNGPTQYDGGACNGCDGEGLVRPADPPAGGGA